MEEFVGPSGLVAERSVNEIHGQAAPFWIFDLGRLRRNVYFRRLRLKRIQSDI
jgi:hypothetical protein